MREKKSRRVRKNAIYRFLSFPHRIYVWAYTKFWRWRGYEDIACTIYPANVFQAQKPAMMLTEKEIARELREIELEERDDPTPQGPVTMSSEVDHIHGVTQAVLQDIIRRHSK